jgi:hypothetical protein
MSHIYPSSEKKETHFAMPFPAPLRRGVEFSDDFFIVKHRQSLAQLVTDHLVLRQGVPLFNVFADFTFRVVSVPMGQGLGLAAIWEVA